MNSKLIIYPTDFSVCAKNAMGYAIAMAKVFKTSIKMVHAIEISGIASSEINASVFLDTIRILEENAEKKIKKLKKEITSFGVDCSYEIIQSQALFLKDYMEQSNPLMIVMGTIGKNGFENKIFGSLASKVISNTKSIVLVIPEKAKYESLYEIVFATDFHSKDIASLEFLKQITQYYGAVLRVVHVIETIKELKAEQNFLSQLETEITKIIGTRNLYFQLFYGEDAEDKLVEFLESSKTDMLALITRKRNFFERIFNKSLSKKMINHTNTPVLVFPS